MEVLQYTRARRSFEKGAQGEAHPRLQVIGFNVSVPKAEAGLEIESSCARAELSFDIKTTSPSPPPLPKPASSPRSALQQLLLHQSVPHTSPPFSNHTLPPLLPLSTSSSSSSANHKPASSSPSSNPIFTSGLLQPTSSSNQTLTSAAPLLQPAATSPPAANQNCTSAFSKSQSRSPSAYQSNSSSARLKSLLQSISVDVPSNQSSPTSFFSSLGQSQCASASSSSRNQQNVMRGSAVSVNLQMINQHDSKPSKVLIKENYEAFFQIKQTGDDKTKEFSNGNDIAKAHEISANELPFVVAKSQRSSWLHDDIEHPSAEKCKKSSWKGVHQINEHPLGNEKSRKSSWNEERSKKSSLFMFMASSPAAEFHHHHHHQSEHNTSKNMDFLSSCHLCRRFLGQNQDVFMYSGDKAFCSMECRYQQIVMDERKERCPPPIIRSGASQVYQHPSVTATTTHHPIMINKPHFIKTAAAA